MKKRISLLIALCLLAVSTLLAQQKYEWTAINGDPLQARIYTLDNGLKVFLTVYKDAPRIQCYIPVKVGSKNDPKETTGLAHYFEHLMFKGTPDFGTTDWAKESVMIKQIEDLFELYRVEKDQAKRNDLYHLIDSISYEASKLAIPNEYNKIMKYIGSQGTNAGTSNDYTIYIENIPSNQLENWAIVQADRFMSPVLRLFHTELETVYEEKNMSLTNDGRKANEVMLAALYPNHPYGQQTTLGESEHLKNPSMKNIREFYEKYYVANNMAVCLSGDFDFDEAIAIIDKHFGKLPDKKLPPFIITPEVPITQPIVKNVIGLEAENIRVAFRMDLPANSKEIYVLNMLDNILSNGKTGLIDLNLNQQQKVYSASGFAYVLCDNSSYILTGKPKTGQTLDEVKDLLLAQIELVKQGSFSDDIMTASINNLRLSEMRQLESNQARAMMMANAFMNNIPWNDACKSIEYYSKITKQDVIDFAKKHFNNNYVVVYKRQGTPDDVEKVNKPAITPIHVNRDAESEFFKKIKNNKVKSIEPVFVDFQKEITFLNYNNVPVLYVQNKENKIFTITFRYKVGELNDLRFPIATDYFDYLGTSKYSAEELKEEFYKLACNLTIRSHDDNSNIVISGLSDNFEKALSLAMELLTDAQPNKVALENLVSDLLKQRNDAKSNQQAILNALRSYSEYGPELSKYALSETQLNALTDEELIKVVQQYLTYKPEILYYGPEDTKTLLNIIGKVYKTPKTFATPQPKKLFEPLLVTQNSVFFAPYEAKQARLVTYNRGNKFNKDLNSIIMMYNQYFGGGMNAIVFQEMREKRSLAYTAQSRYVTPAEKDEYMYNFSFIATQNDKIVDAFTAFNELFNDMPHSQTAFQLAKEGAKTAIETNRITKAPILYTYIGNRELGYDYDYRKDFYNAIDKFTLKDLVEFNHLYIKDKPKTYMILSKEDDVDFKTVEEKFGKVTKLTLEQIFGY